MTAQPGGWTNLVCFVDADAPGRNDGTSWEHACRSLHHALALSGPGNEIRVAQGTYRPGGAGNGFVPDRAATFQLISGVTIKGGYAGFGEPDPDARDVEGHPTILSGDLAGDDEAALLNETRKENAFHVVTGSGVDRTAVLDGFTITAGHAVEDRTGSNDNGGGMHNDAGSPTVIACTFEANAADDQSGGGGGGMYNRKSSPSLVGCTFVRNGYILGDDDGGGAICNFESSPSLVDCVFRENTSNGHGGAIRNCRSDPELSGCTFSKNHAKHGGGAIFNEHSDPTMTDCRFVDNWARQGGGAVRNHVSSPTFINCRFEQNSATVQDSFPYGGAMYSSYLDNPTVIGCVFLGNHAKAGGALYNYWGESTVVGCLFQNNSASSGGGAVYAMNCDASLANSILWDNRAPVAAHVTLMHYGHSATTTVSYCNIQGGVTSVVVAAGDVLEWGDGNIDADPMLVRPGGPLRPGSPCIDAGDNGAAPASLSADLASNPRYVDDPSTVDTGQGAAPIVDIGPYEFQAPSVLFVDAAASGNGDGTRWADAFTNLYDACGRATDGCLVLVTNGSYEIPGEILITRAITVRSVNGADVTIVDGGFPNRTNRCFHILDLGAVLDGFTIMNGHTSGNDCGGGVKCSGAGLVQNCTIMGNASSAQAGGIDLEWGGTIRNCRVTGNTADWSGGGVRFWYGGVIENCLINGNAALSSIHSGGGGVASAGPGGVVRNSTITGNSSADVGGGIRAWHDIIVVNSIIAGNHAPDSPNYSGVKFAFSCSTPLAPGVGNIAADPLFVDGPTGAWTAAPRFDAASGLTMLTDGEAVWSPGSLVGQSVNPDVSRALQYRIVSNGETTVTVRGNLAFAVVVGDSYRVHDYRLGSGSPCIDAANNAAVLSAVVTDLSGNARFLDDPGTPDTGNGTPPIVDMGAYEYARTAPPTNRIVLIARASMWRFLDDGSDQGSDWREPAFHDGDWSVGHAQLGYGDGDEATVVGYGPDPKHKHITTYFRKTFDLSDVSRVAALSLQLLRDDGAVVYLNGVEALRSNMRRGPIGYRTRARRTIGGEHERPWLHYSLDPSALTAGRNVLAAEIHQVHASSSDISFDCELSALLSGAPGLLSLSGDVCHDGPQEGAVCVEVFSRQFCFGWVARTVLAGPGPYTVDSLPAGGNYWVRAYLDGNGNGVLDWHDPVGAYRGNPLRNLSSSVTGIDIRLHRSRCRWLGRQEGEGDARSVDSDGDGMSDADEWLAGTHALEQDHVLRILSVKRAPGRSGHVTVQWSGVDGQRYTLSRSTDLARGFEVVATDIPGLSPVTCFVDRRPGSGQVFYRVKTR